MDFLFKIWPYIEKFGPPFLAFIALITWLSLNFYLIECKNLLLLERYINNHGSTRGFYRRPFPVTGLVTLIYAFKPTSTFDKNLLKYKRFREQLENIQKFRKAYKLIFPILIILALVGITINELVIDK